MNNRMILAVDPGKASGICLFKWTEGQEPEMLWSGEYQQHEYADPIRRAFSYSQSQGVRLEVVCERFTINAQTTRNAQAPYSLEQIGILKQIMMDYGRVPDDIYFQSPADAKAMFTNEKIRIVDYWHRGGEGHALDSIRHALLRLAKSGWVPVKLLK
jgi:hypothetical protein